MRFLVLGPVELAGDGWTAGVPSRRRRLLLAALLARQGELVGVDQLIDALWGADPPASAGPSLQSHVSRLRAELRELDSERDRIVTRRGAYGLVLADHDEIDAITFEQEVRRARGRVDDDPATAVDLVEHALARWRGPPYVDAVDAVEDEVRRLWSVHRMACDVRVEGLLAAGRADTVLGELQARLEQDPLDERAAGQLMLALFHSGRQAEAIGVFHDYRRRLGDELGVDPSPWLRDRYDALVRQDEGLVAPPASSNASAGRERTPSGLLVGAATSFVGRDAAVADVASLVTSRSLVTLTGPGGVGKTRLAEAVGEAVSGVFDDVIALRLAAMRDPSALGAAVAGACGIVPGEDTAIRDTLVEALRGREVLLIADNCEHLLPDVAELVEYLLGRCPHLTVLATSRERLAVRGEHRWPVTPLRLPAVTHAVTLDEVWDSPAVRVFRDRAEAADPAFELTGDNAAVVTEVCRRLDGLPLALELAAARVAAFTVAELARRLDERFALLTTGPPHDGGRHRTLRDVVAWSYELLTREEADLFDRLSVFAGGFTLDAAEEVAGGGAEDPGAVAARLAALVDCSMVARSGSRYVVLETLRLYGADRLAERGQVDAAKRAHARFFARFSQQADPGIRGADDDVWVPRVEAELDNLRAAHRWAVDSGDADLALRVSAPLGLYGGWWLVDEVTTWAEEAADIPGAEGHPLLPVAYGAAAHGAGNRGQLERSAALARQGLAAASEDDPARILPLRALSLVAFFQGTLEMSSQLEAEVRDLAEAVGDRYHVAYAWVMWTLIATYRGEADAALAAARRAGQEAAALGNTHMRALTAYCRGEALAPQDPDAAVPWLDEAVGAAHEIGTRLVEAIALVTRSSVRAERGDPDAALASFWEAIDRLRRGGDWTHQWTTLRNLVFLLVRLGTAEAAEAAAGLIGALETSATAAQVYGADAARLRAVTAQLRDRLGKVGFDAEYERGRRMTDPDAVDVALTTIDRMRGAATRG
ncbi:BTAD domain-containing putative transcriptional regulator [Haloechinothrix halophila]|uniref:BTAD domain-containing putative transcriptional regulator n=1 Tax=Haloechinothrix halophila TaxID=1069073 RepID=UPI000686BCAD|nr:BTAD domain-containing putative transcriptional regulator [Haloechinothrix halophila]